MIKGPDHSIYIASDHVGFQLKEQLIKHLSSINLMDIGTYGPELVDYVDYAIKTCNTMKYTDRAILICGSGVGMSIVANRFKHVRAVLGYNIRMVEVARQHNDVNVLCLGARFLDTSSAIDIVKAFLDTKFSEEDRHIRRINKIDTHNYE